MKFTNPHNLPQNIVDFLVDMSGTYDGPGATDSTRISVTTLIDSPQVRRLKLKHFHDIEKDIRRLQHAALGTLVHGVFENHYRNKEYTKVEERLEMKIGGVLLSGQYDRLEVLATNEKLGKLIDIKTTGAFSLKGDKLHQYFKQANIYRYMLWKIKGIDTTEAELFVVMRDWQESKSRQKKKDSDSLQFPDYPKCMFDVVKVPIKPYDEIEEYIKSRIKLHTSSETPECSEKERWSDPIKYAVMVKGTVRSQKNHLTKEDAFDHMISLQENGIDSYIEERRPSRENVRCKLNYCDVSKFCPQYKKWKKQNEYE